MSKRTSPARVVFADFKAMAENEGAVDIEMPNGDVIRVPPPQLWPDEAVALIHGGVQNTDVIALARVVLGDEVYTRFSAAGGTAAALSAILEEQAGTDLGESPASSSP